jgi:hypothetical protein
MWFIVSLGLVVLVAFLYACVVLSNEILGVERTKVWIWAVPKGLVYGVRWFFRALLLMPLPSEVDQGAGRRLQVPSQSRPAVVLRSPPRAVVHRERRTAQPSRGEFGGREAIQLLGAACLVAKVFGWLDVDGLEEVEGVGELEGADALTAGELPPNPGDHYVDPYVRDGQIVEGHFRTNADATDLNNYSGPHGDHFRRLNGRG